VSAAIPSRTAHNRLRQALLSPSRIALVGASDDPQKATSRPLAFLRDGGSRAQVYVVNRHGREVGGSPAYQSLTALPEVPDHVFIMTPAAGVLDTVHQCASMGVPVATILSGGFAEEGEAGLRLQQELVECARAGSVRLLGPNSLGLVNLHESLRLTGNAFFAEEQLPVGGTFVASQSGSLIGALVSRGAAKGVGFSTVISVGGEADLSIGEICSLVLDDPAVTGYMLFLETIQRASDLAQFAQQAAERSKPVVAYKLGRSNAAAQMATAHTGALATDDDLADAFLNAYGIARVHSIDGLLEAEPLMRKLPVPATPRPHRRVAVVTTTGGGAAMLVDQLSLRGIDVQRPGAQTYKDLALAGVEVAQGPVVDLTLAGTRYDAMKATLDVLAAAPEFDLVIAVVGSSACTQPDLAIAPIADSAQDSLHLAAFVVPHAPNANQQLTEAGVPNFTSPETCADVIASALRRHRPITRTLIEYEPPQRRQLNEAQSYQRLAAVQIVAAPYLEMPTADITATTELPFRYPVAVKILEPGIAHKSDVDGVVLSVGDAHQLVEALSVMRGNLARHLPGRPALRVLVQQMVGGLAEMLLGYRLDLQVGPVVVLAAGGVQAEIYRDRSVRLAPVDHSTARDMMEEVRAAGVLHGYRGRKAGDTQALAEAIVAMSQLATDTSVAEAEINPLIVREVGLGVVAVDALVVLNDSAPKPRP
jgi:acetate---CoA ligase (ADP-forming)